MLPACGQSDFRSVYAKLHPFIMPQIEGQHLFLRTCRCPDKVSSLPSFDGRDHLYRLRKNSVNVAGVAARNRPKQTVQAWRLSR